MLVGTGDAGLLEEWLRRRENGEPLAWITGTLQFCGRPVHVDPGVYVPRLQSEQLARAAAAALAHSVTPGRRGRAADLCTGAGAIALHLAAAVPGALVVGVDNDPAAAACARRNGVPTLVGDLAEPLRSGSFDVVTAVAPYVPSDALRWLPADVQRYEPLGALDGGSDGLACLRRVVTGAARLLRPAGWLLVELGGEQDDGLTPALSAAGFTAPTRFEDEEGDLRALTARWRDDA